jgi:hypothetical protein
LLPDSLSFFALKFSLHLLLPVFAFGKNQDSAPGKYRGGSKPAEALISALVKDWSTLSGCWLRC